MRFIQCSPVISGSIKKASFVPKIAVPYFHPQTIAAWIGATPQSAIRLRRNTYLRERHLRAAHAHNLHQRHNDGDLRVA